MKVNAPCLIHLQFELTGNIIKIVSFLIFYGTALKYTSIEHIHDFGIREDGERTACGRLANPPGIFAKMFVNGNLFNGYPVLSNLAFSSTDGVYFYETFDDKKDQPDMWELPKLINIKKVLQRRILMFHTYLLNLLKAKANMVHATTSLALTELASIVDSTLQKVNHFNYINMTVMYFSDFTRNITILSRLVDTQLEKLKDVQYLYFDLSLKEDIPFLFRYQQLIRGHFQGLVWELYEGSLPYWPSRVSLGVKGIMSFTILSWTLTIRGEWAIADDSLMTCSKYLPYYDHIKGGQPTLIRGVIETFYPTDTSMFDVFWQILRISIGSEVLIAFSKATPMFTLKVQVSLFLMNLKLQFNLYITNNEILFETVVKIFHTFEVHLSLQLAIPYTPQDMALYVKGRFIITQKKSLHDKLWDSMKRIAKADQTSLSERLGYSKSAKNAYMLKHRKASEKLESAVEILNSKNKTFTTATNRMLIAEQKLRETRSDFEKLHVAYKQALQPDKICALQECTQLRCKMRNMGCRAVRVAVYAALVAGKTVLNVPIIALSVAERAVAAARNIHEVAKDFYEEAKQIYEDSSSKENLLIRFIRKSDVILALLQDKLNEAADIVTSLAGDTINDIFKVKNCEFLVELSVKNIFAVEVGCEMQLLNLGWSTLSFELNAKDVFGSMYSVGKRLVESVKEKLFNGRKKRSATFPEFTERSSFNLNGTNPIYVDPLSWNKRCHRFTLVYDYLTKTLSVLTTLLLKNTINTATAEKTLIDLEADLSYSSNVSFRDVSLDFEAISNVFNLSHTTIEEAFRSVELANDPAIKDWRGHLENGINKTTIQLNEYREYRPYADLVRDMDSVSSPGACFSVPDCWLWSLEEVSELLSSVDPFFSNRQRKTLEDLQETLTRVLNDNFTANRELNINITGLQNLHHHFCGKVPLIARHPADVLIEIGKTAEFTCETTSADPSTYFWYKGDNLLVYGVNRTVFHVTNVSLDDEGYYKCMAGNHIDNVSSSIAKLEVGIPSILIDEFGTIEEHFVGQTILFQNKTLGNPMPLVSVISFPTIYIENSSDLLFFNTPGLFLVKYFATNLFRTVESRETLHKVNSVYPQCPTVWVTCALNRRPYRNLTGKESNGKLCGGLSTDGNSTTRRKCLQQILDRMLETNETSTSSKVMFFNAIDGTVKIRLMVNCNFSRDFTVQEVDQIVKKIRSQISEPLRYLKAMVDASLDLFVHQNVVYSMSPAYWYVHQGLQSCVDGHHYREPHYCVEELPEFSLPAPRHLKAFCGEDRLQIQWNRPSYADGLVQEYSLTVDGDDDAYAYALNTSSTDTNATLELGYCSAKCKVYVSALTQSYRSKWAVFSLECHKGFAADNSVVIMVSITAGVLMVIVILILLVTRQTRTSRKIATSDSQSLGEGLSSANQERSTTTTKIAWQPSEDHLPKEQYLTTIKQIHKPETLLSNRSAHIKSAHRCQPFGQSVFMIQTDPHSYNIDSQYPNIPGSIDDIQAYAPCQAMPNYQINNEHKIDNVVIYNVNDVSGTLTIDHAKDSLAQQQLGTDQVVYAEDNSENTKAVLHPVGVYPIENALAVLQPLENRHSENAGVDLDPVGQCHTIYAEDISEPGILDPTEHLRPCGNTLDPVNITSSNYCVSICQTESVLAALDSLGVCTANPVVHAEYPAGACPTRQTGYIVDPAVSRSYDRDVNKLLSDGMHSYDQTKMNIGSPHVYHIDLVTDKIEPVLGCQIEEMVGPYGINHKNYGVDTSNPKQFVPVDGGVDTSHPGQFDRVDYGTNPSSPGQFDPVDYGTDSSSPGQFVPVGCGADTSNPAQLAYATDSVCHQRRLPNVDVCDTIAAVHATVSFDQSSTRIQS